MFPTKRERGNFKVITTLRCFFFFWSGKMLHAYSEMNYVRLAPSTMYAVLFVLLSSNESTSST